MKDDNALSNIDDVESGSTSPSADNESQSTDELQAVRDDAKQDTMHVQRWRFLVTGALLITAVAVTWSTYAFLHDEQVDSFRTAFDQFSRTVGDAALEQQRNLDIGFEGLANAVSAHVQSTNQSWPSVTIPFFRTHAATFLRQSKMEVTTLLHRVDRHQIDAWAEFGEQNHEAMMVETHMLENGNTDDLARTDYHPFITRSSPNGFIKDIDRDSYFASWEYAPAPFTYQSLNWNVLSVPEYLDVAKAAFEMRNQTLFSSVRPYTAVVFSEEEHEAMHSALADSSTEHPHTFFFRVVNAEVGNPDSEIVALLGGGGSWDAAWLNLLPDNVKGLFAIISNSCNQSYTYEINGKDAIFVGEGDRHDRDYEKYRRVVDLAVSHHPKFESTPGHCRYRMEIYPSKAFEETYDKMTPEIFTIFVAITFVMVAVVFFVYDMFVYRRNEKLIENAARSNAIVSTLFPSNIRRRIIKNDEVNGGTADKRITSLKNFLSGDRATHNIKSKPLADLFLETTILFADIAGFTAWSSVREPTQVFTFLESVFASFDKLAKAHRVFKVETVGDCYVAATGLPDPKPDHAAVMVGFARDLLYHIDCLTKDLEITHGPDTGDLSLRIGMHSGPVTAGVLRGERARFQLFGDTMNTAARIEHTGEVGRIQVSSDTAECLRQSGKSDWLIRREGTVNAKGKGEIQTYWITDEHSFVDGSNKLEAKQSERANTVSTDTNRSETAPISDEHTDKQRRLVDWNVEMMLLMVRQIIARRNGLNKASKKGFMHSKKASLTSATSQVEDFVPLDEVQEIIHLPDYDPEIADHQLDPDLVDVDDAVVEQLHDYVTNISRMYRDNPFHNFEHASHVTMSVIKLLARIVAPTDLQMDSDMRGGTDNAANSSSERSVHGNRGHRHRQNSNDSTASGRIEQFNDEHQQKQHHHGITETLHDHTYGITSDPLTQLACAFSALIHDVDHNGVPNAQLVKENTRIAQIYNNRSVAEQNSLVLAWDLFMMDDYEELRACLCPTSKDLARFRQLVVNCVMATDIVDKELKLLRNGRWDKAFQHRHEESHHDAVNRRATIVIEHLIQASDVAHTMQHWHIYRKWNERFFYECHAAYQNGRAGEDPTMNWYKGELGFFDFYIIPLAKKLKDCGVFGKSSDEYLNYAMANRKEWERRGEEMVSEMVRNLHAHDNEAHSSMPQVRRSDSHISIPYGERRK